jgi:Ca2+-binding EF-hand superfamily protein
MRRNRTLIGITIMTLLLGALAVGLTDAAEQECCDDLCRPTAENWAEFLKANDANADGMISREEFPGQPQAFARIDADKSGQITQQEAVAAEVTHQMRQGQRGRLQGMVDPRARWERLIDHHDADGNGAITREEFGGPDHAFARLDGDGNGSLTKDEVLSATPRMRQGRMHDGARRGAGRGAGCGMGQGQGAANA